MCKFKAEIEIIGINPFVFVPGEILNNIFTQAGRGKGPIPICGTLNGRLYKQTLVKYAGYWRLYINTIMLENSPKRVGESVEITVAFDPTDRTIEPHPTLLKALSEYPEAKKIFDQLPASKQKEIVRYIAHLKTPEHIDKNVHRAIDFLLGKGRFIGRDKP